MLLNHIHIKIECSNYLEFLKKYIRIIDFWVLCKIRKGSGFCVKSGKVGLFGRDYILIGESALKIMFTQR